MESKNYTQLLEQQKNYMIANQSKITDFNEGSVIMTIFEAVARILERFYIETRTGYSSNLKAIAYSIFGFNRKEGTNATAKVTFIANKEVSETTRIMLGTVVAAGSYEFETTEIAVIPAGEKVSNTVSVTSKGIGAAYNVTEGEINTIVSNVPLSVVEVINEAKAYGGSDAESDSETLVRFRQYINGLQGGSSYAIKSAVLNTEGVRSVSIEEHFPLKENVFNFTLYVDDGTGNLTPTLKNKISDIVNGNDTSSLPGAKSAGVNVDIAAPVQVPISLSGTVYTYRTERAQAENEINEAMKQLVNGLGINESVLLTDVILKLRSLSYVKDIKNLKINDVTDNMTIAVNQIARLESVENLIIKSI